MRFTIWLYTELPQFEYSYCCWVRYNPFGFYSYLLLLLLAPSNPFNRTAAAVHSPLLLSWHPMPTAQTDAVCTWHRSLLDSSAGNRAGPRPPPEGVRTALLGRAHPELRRHSHSSNNGGHRLLVLPTAPPTRPFLHLTARHGHRKR